MSGSIRKRYVDGPFGQVHARMTAAVVGTMPLICLHATAYSSRTFVPLMHQSGHARQVIAIDLPGYGESDAPGTQVDITGYADAVAIAIRALAGPGPVVLLGYPPVSMSAPNWRFGTPIWPRGWC